MKKKEISLLFFLFISTLIYSQRNDKTVDVEYEHKATTIYVSYNGIFFYPYSDKENIIDSMMYFCNKKKYIYFLNSIELSEEQFISLQLKSKHIVGKKGWFNFNYIQADTTDCIESINLYAKTNLFIMLNGKRINDNEKENLMIKNANITYINRRKRLFKKDEIEILTK